MIRDQTEQFRASEEERELITLMSQLFQRNRSDTLRLILRNAANELGIVSDNPVSLERLVIKEN